MALATFALANRTFAIASRLELLNEARLFVLGERARDLAHHLARRVAAICQVVPVACQHAHAPLDERDDAKLLRHELASEAGSILDEYGAHAIAFDPIEQCRETGAGLDRISTRYRRIIELID